jgi:hypothetical protein
LVCLHFLTIVFLLPPFLWTFSEEEASKTCLVVPYSINSFPLRLVSFACTFVPSNATATCPSLIVDDSS